MIQAKPSAMFELIQTTLNMDTNRLLSVSCVSWLMYQDPVITVGCLQHRSGKLEKHKTEPTLILSYGHIRNAGILKGHAESRWLYCTKSQWL